MSPSKPAVAVRLSIDMADVALRGDKRFSIALGGPLVAVDDK